MENEQETEELYLEEIEEESVIEKPKVHGSKGKPITEQQKANLQKGRETLIKRKQERILAEAKQIKEKIEPKKKAPPKKKSQIVISTDDTDSQDEDGVPEIIIRNRRRQLPNPPPDPRLAFEERTPIPELHRPPTPPRRLKRV